MEENNYQQPVVEENDGSITLLDLWFILRRYFFRILLLTAILTIVAGVIFNRTIKTTYTAQASIIMNPGLIDSNNGSIDASDSTNHTIAENYAYYNQSIRFLPSIAKFIKTSQRIKDDVREKFDEKEAFRSDDDSRTLSEQELAVIDGKLGKKALVNYVEPMTRGTVTVSYSSDELQIFISYTTTTSSETARATVVAIADSVCQISKTKENGQYIYLWSTTLHVDDVPKNNPAGVNRWTLYTLIAAVGLFVIFYVYYLIMTLIDDTIKSKREIEMISGFNVMAYIEEIGNGKSSSSKKSDKKKRSSKISAT